MAVNVGVNLNPNTKKVEAALARIQAQAKGIDFGGGARSIEKLSRPLGKITGQATEFQKSLEASNARVLAFGASVAVINKLSQAFGALVENTIRVEATFAKINTILGGTQKQLEQFGNGIFAVAQKTATSFDQVAEGALELARQGLSVEESLSRVETSLKLVRVAGIDSQQAVAGLTAAIKGFEGAGLTVAQIADKLAEVDTKFAVSTEDLINGLERASASARVAGVSFDELLAVVTTVQERTQRGGAVIGNAFKTIFARLGRTDTLVALEELGISVLDSEGNVRAAIPLFEELAFKLDELGLKSVQAGDVIQKVAGVRQRDILISLVEDLTSGQSQFANALNVSAGAAGSLDRKNAQLNDTLEALINNLAVGAQKLSSVIGELGFADAAKDILKVFSSVVNGITDLLQGDSIGSKFAQGLVKGIGSILTGPGLALISAIFVKLFVDLAKFGASSLKSLLGINKAAQAQAALQQSVLQTLLQNENIQREILALEGNKVAQEQLLLKIYNQQAAALARVQKAAATVTPGLFGAGLRGGERGVQPKGRGAGGYIAAEARDVSRGVGGAPASSKVVSIPNFAFGGGKHGTMVANTSEYLVPNYAGGGDAIFNRDMVRSMGLPAGARKINAAGGFVPNFAVTQRPRSLERLRGLAKGSGPEAKAAKAELAKRQKAKSQQKLIYSPRFAMIVPQVIGPKQKIQGVRGGKKVAFDLVGFEPGVGSRVRNDEQLDASVKKYAIGLANAEAKKLGAPPRPEKISKLANTGAISALAGTIFETSVSSLINSSDFDSRSEIAAFDFAGSGANKKLKKLFPQLGSATEIEAKIRPSKGNRESMFDKILKATGNAALGYIPNFAGGALDEAVAREQAAGLPINQIRINQSGKLRSAQNPMGLAVTNTRDEPTGRIPNFAKGRSGDLGSNALLISTLLFGLGGAFGDAESAVGKFTSALSTGLSVLFSLSLLKGPLESLSGKITNFGLDLATNPAFTGVKGRAAGNIGRTVASFGKLLPVIGNIIALGSILVPIASQFGLFGKKTDDASESLENFKGALDAATEEEKKKILEEKRTEKAAAEARLKALEGGSARGAPSFLQSLSLGAVGPAGVRVPSTSGPAIEQLVDAATKKEIEELGKDIIRLGNEVEIATASFVKTSLSLEEEGKKFDSGKAKRVTSQFAAQRLEKSGTLLRGRLAVEDVGEQGVTGDRKTLLKEELRLAKAIGTAEKVNAENTISQLKFDIDARKQRFKITEDLKSSLKKGSDISAEALKILLEQVEAGADLNEIQKSLKENGEELTGKTKEQFEIDLEALRILNLKLAAQQQELDNEIKINNLKKDTSFGEGLRQGLGQLDEDIEFFRRNLGEEVPRLFADNLGTALKDAVRGAETLGDALKGAARGFLETLSEKFLQQAADQATQAIFSVTRQTDTTPGPVQFLGEALGGGKPDGSTPQKALNVKDVSAGAGGGAKGIAEELKGEGDKEGGIFGELGEKFKNIFGELKNTFSDLFGGLKDSLGNIFGSLKDSFGSIFKNIGGLFGGGGGGGGGGIFGSILGAFTGGLGGLFSFFNQGGSVGRGTDTVPAMLTPGEFVVKKDAVDKYGTSFLSALNNGALPMRGFQNGGAVAPVSSEVGSAAAAGPVTNNSDFTFNIDQGGQVRQEGTENQSDQQKQFAQRIRSAVVTIIQEESRIGGTLNGFGQR